MAQKKIMGLPTVVWMGVLAGGLLLGLWLRHRGGSQAGSSGSISDAVAGGGVAPASPGMDSNTMASLLGGYPVAVAGGPGVSSSRNPDGSRTFFDANGEELGTWFAQLYSGVTGTTTPVVNVPSSGGSGSSAAGLDPKGRAIGQYFSGGHEYIDPTGQNPPTPGGTGWKYDPYDYAWRSDWDPSHPGFLMGET